MATNNSMYLAGHLSQESITNGSWFVNNYWTKGKTGRKSLVSCEYLDPSKDSLIGLTLVDKSLFILIPTYYPEIYTDVPSGDILNKSFKAYWNYICQTCRAVDGIPDLALDIQRPVFKSAFFSLPLCTTLQNPVEEITLTIPAELSNYFIIKQTRHWMNAISDEYSKAATYNGLETEFNNFSHSAGMAYIKPNKTFDRVEYGALFFLMIPKQAPTSNFNADATAAGVIEMSIPFNVAMVDDRNVRVRELLQSLLISYRTYVVLDSTLYGLTKNTALDTVDELIKREIFNNMMPTS